MDHVVYVDAKSEELEKILARSKAVVVRGAMGRKLPYGLVAPGDILYFIRNNGEGRVRARATVRTVTNSAPLTLLDSVRLVQEQQVGLQLSPEQFKRWAGKRYLVLIEIEAPEVVEPFEIDRSGYGIMDDWLPVGEIKNIRR
jgi:hypothetical protein